MNIELHPLSTADGMDIYDMLQEIPADENGFMNGMCGRGIDDFRLWLTRCMDASKGIGLEDWQVPQSTYWLYVDGKPVGFGKIRHRLTDKLRADGGHIGYAIRPSCRGKGYGSLQLRMLLQEAKRLGIDQALVTIQNGNAPSLRTALGNGGVIEKVTEEKHYIWLNCDCPDASTI